MTPPLDLIQRLERTLADHSHGDPDRCIWCPLLRDCISALRSQREALDAAREALGAWPGSDEQREAVDRFLRHLQRADRILAAAPSGEQEGPTDYIPGCSG